MPPLPALAAVLAFALVAGPAQGQVLDGAPPAGPLAGAAVAAEESVRSPGERVLLIAAAAVPAAVTGTLWGFADGTQNDWRHANVAEGGEGPRSAVLNARWHGYAAGARVMIAVDLGAALGIGAAARPDWPETLALAATGGVAVLLSHHLAHNVQQGESLLYFGEVAPTDRLARRIGEVPVAIATAAATGAVLYLVYRVLD